MKIMWGFLKACLFPRALPQSYQIRIYRRGAQTTQWVLYETSPDDHVTRVETHGGQVLALIQNMTSWGMLKTSI